MLHLDSLHWVALVHKHARQCAALWHQVGVTIALWAKAIEWQTIDIDIEQVGIRREYAAVQEVDGIYAGLTILRLYVEHLLPTDLGIRYGICLQLVGHRLIAVTLLPCYSWRYGVTWSQVDIVVIGVWVEALQRVALHIDHLQGIYRRLVNRI